MPVKDLTRHLVPALELRMGERTYQVRPPSAANGELLTKLLGLGIRAVARPGEVGEKDVEAAFTPAEQVFINGERALEQLSLGRAIVEQMHADEMPLIDIQMAGRYAAFYWVLGPEGADSILVATSNAGGPQEETDALPKPSRSGRSTASVTPSRTAPTGATTSRKQSARSNSGKPRKA